MGFVSDIIGSITGSTQADAAKDAAKTQTDAANRAVDIYQQQYNQTRNDLLPYAQLGTSNVGALQNAVNNPILTQSFSAPTAAEAAATPGYQFTLNNGLKAVQNSASARGLGVSGAAQKGAASYAAGLADSTYNDSYNRALTTYNANQATAGNQVNRLLGLVTTGENAAAGTAAAGNQTATNTANALTSGAAASAAGTVGAANAAGTGLSNLTSIGTTLANSSLGQKAISGITSLFG